MVVQAAILAMSLEPTARHEVQKPSNLRGCCSAQHLQGLWRNSEVHLRGGQLRGNDNGQRLFKIKHKIPLRVWGLRSKTKSRVLKAGRYVELRGRVEEQPLLTLIHA